MHRSLAVGVVMRVTMACALLCISHPASAMTAEEVGQRLIGIWEAQVGKQAQHRVLEVRGIDPDGSGGFTAEALLGPADTPHRPPATMTVVATGPDDMTVQIVTFTNARIHASLAGVDALAGSFTSPDGGRWDVHLTRVQPGVPAAGRAPRPKTLDDVRESLVNTWVVEVGRQERQRILEVRSVDASGPGRFAAQAVYGWYDTVNPKPVPMAVTTTETGLNFELTTPSAAILRAKLVDHETLAGTLEQQERTWLVSGKLVGHQRPEAAPLRAGKVTLVYVGARDCPACRAWEATRSPQPKTWAFADFVDYRHVTSNTYMATGDDMYWDVDLRWIRDKTYTRSGTPRFIVAVNDRITLNVVGGARWDASVLPYLQRLAGLRAKQ